MRASPHRVYCLCILGIATTHTIHSCTSCFQPICIHSPRLVGINTDPHILPGVEAPYRLSRVNPHCMCCPFTVGLSTTHTIHSCPSCIQPIYIYPLGLVCINTHPHTLPGVEAPYCSSRVTLHRVCCPCIVGLATTHTIHNCPQLYSAHHIHPLSLVGINTHTPRG